MFKEGNVRIDDGAYLVAHIGYIFSRCYFSLGIGDPAKVYQGDYREYGDTQQQYSETNQCNEEGEGGFMLHKNTPSGEGDRAIPLGCYIGGDNVFTKT
jgi:hypothetical protein